MLDGVIFDMDGLMFDTEPIWMRAWPYALERVGVAFNPELAASTRGTTGKVMDAIINRYLPDVDATYVRETLTTIAHGMMTEGVPKKPGLDELLATLKELGIPLAVASSSSPELIEMHLSKGGVREYFSAIVSGMNLERSKPEPDIFLKAAETIGVAPAHTLVLEDSLSGVRAGVAGGFVTVMVPDLDVPTDEICAMVTCVCTDLLEVRDLIVADKLG